MVEIHGDGPKVGDPTVTWKSRQGFWDGEFATGDQTWRLAADLRHPKTNIAEMIFVSRSSGFEKTG